MSRQQSWHAHLCRIALGCILVLGVATTALAQFDRGTITGTIKDSQGGIVPGASVTITSTQTQQSRTTVTDEGLWTSGPSQLVAIAVRGTLNGSLTLGGPMPTTIAVRPWPDPVIDTLGHDPRSVYVDFFKPLNLDADQSPRKWLEYRV